MTDISPESGSGGGAQLEANGDEFDTEFEAARVAETDEGGADDIIEIDPATGDTVAKKPEEKSAEKPPLANDELTKRWNDSKAALKAERAEKRGLKAEVDRLRALVENAPAKAAPPAAQTENDAEPDPEVDPIGAIKYWAKYAKTAQGQDREHAQKQEQAARETQQQQARRQELAEFATRHETAFSQVYPDYQTAYQHFAKARAEELADEGYSAREIPNVFQGEMLKLIENCENRDTSPAEAVYKLAQRRGYGPKAGKMPQDTAAALDKTAKTLQQVERGQAANKSLSSGGRPQGGGVALTAGNVANLKGQAFDVAFEKLRAQERRAGR